MVQYVFALIQQPDLSPIANLPANQKKFEGYYKISRHYKWALDQRRRDLGTGAPSPSMTCMGRLACEVEKDSFMLM